MAGRQNLNFARHVSRQEMFAKSSGDTSEGMRRDTIYGHKIPDFLPAMRAFERFDKEF